MDDLLKRLVKDHADKHQEILDNIAVLRDATGDLAESILEHTSIIRERVTPTTEELSREEVGES